MDSQHFSQHNFGELPTVLIYKILSELKPIDLGEICKSSKYISKICNEEDFWNFKHINTMGTLPPREDKRLIYYKRRASQLDDISDALIQETRNRIRNLIYSALTIHTNADELEEINQSVRYISRRGQCISFDSYTDFETAMLCYFRPKRRRGVSPKGQISEKFESWINPNAELFKMYPLSEYNDDPVLALIRAIYDTKFEYTDRHTKILDEMFELNDLIENLEKSTLVNLEN